jgi:hypothetical protein
MLNTDLFFLGSWLLDWLFFFSWSFGLFDFFGWLRLLKEKTHRLVKP